MSGETTAQQIQRNMASLTKPLSNRATVAQLESRLADLERSGLSSAAAAVRGQLARMK